MDRSYGIYSSSSVPVFAPIASSSCAAIAFGSGRIQRKTALVQINNSPKIYFFIGMKLGYKFCSCLIVSFGMNQCFFYGLFSDASRHIKYNWSLLQILRHVHTDKHPDSLQHASLGHPYLSWWQACCAWLWDLFFSAIFEAYDKEL